VNSGQSVLFWVRGVGVGGSLILLLFWCNIGAVTFRVWAYEQKLGGRESYEITRFVVHAFSVQ